MSGYNPGSDFTVGSLYGEMRGDYEHNGVDYPAPAETAIPSAANGVVVGRGTHKDYGNMALVLHDDPSSLEDVYTLYAHMPDVEDIPAIGTRVTRGQTIGAVGSTGNSTGPHLHFEVIRRPAGSWWSVEEPWEGGATGLAGSVGRSNPLEGDSWGGLDVYEGTGTPPEPPAEPHRIPVCWMRCNHFIPI